MNTINSAAKVIKPANDYLKTLNAAVKGEVLISDQALIFVFESTLLDTDIKIKYANFILEHKISTEPQSVAYFNQFILDNTPEIIQPPQGIINTVMSFVRDRIKKIS